MLLYLFKRIWKAMKDLYKAVELYPGFVKYIKEDEELHILKDRKDFMNLIK